MIFQQPRSARKIAVMEALHVAAPKVAVDLAQPYGVLHMAELNFYN